MIYIDFVESKWMEEVGRSEEKWDEYRVKAKGEGDSDEARNYVYGDGRLIKERLERENTWT